MGSAPGWAEVLAHRAPVDPHAAAAMARYRALGPPKSSPIPPPAGGGRARASNVWVELRQRLASTQCWSHLELAGVRVWWFDGLRLPTHNQVISAMSAKPFLVYAYKKACMRLVGRVLAEAPALASPITTPFTVEVLLRTPRGLDRDNAATATKYLIDALVREGVLHGDSPKWMCAHRVIPCRGDYGVALRVVPVAHPPAEVSWSEMAAAWGIPEAAPGTPPAPVKPGRRRAAFPAPRSAAPVQTTAPAAPRAQGRAGDPPSSAPPRRRRSAG